MVPEITVGRKGKAVDLLEPRVTVAVGLERREPHRPKSLGPFVIPGGGLEPPSLAALDFESSASTNSATGARLRC